MRACATGKPGKRLILAALSGGADSTAMTAALASLRETAGRPCNPESAASVPPFELYALHVNHGIRPAVFREADEEAAAVLCKKLDILLTVKRIPPGTVKAYARQCGTGIEGAARHFRYTALREEARRLGADAICTAHTADDRLETILMAFLRGAGPAGLGALGGVPGPEDPPPKDPPPIIRPLLSVGRNEVLAYLRERGIPYCTDETNADERFFRNRVRAQLVPFLDRHFPHWREPVLRLGETQAMTAAFLAEEAEKRLPWDNSRLSAETFFSQPEILREEALFRAMDDCARNSGTVHEEAPQSAKKKNPRRETIRSFVRGGTAVADFAQCRVENRNGLVTVQKTGVSFSETGFSVLIKKAGIYKLERLIVCASAGPVDSRGVVFYGTYPLVLRSAGGKILAEDREGRAAVIQGGALVWKRKPFQKSGDESFSVHLN